MTEKECHPTDDDYGAASFAWRRLPSNRLRAKLPPLSFLPSFTCYFFHAHVHRCLLPPSDHDSTSVPQRAKLFKAGVGRDEARRGRSETQVQIRKEKKEERLNQRRRKGSAGDALGGFSFATIPEGGAPAAGTNNATAAETPAHMRVRAERSCSRAIIGPVGYLM